MDRKNQTIKLDALGLDKPIKGKEFPYDKAKKIMLIQARNGKSDWTISPSENKTFIDGDFRSSSSEKDSKSGAKG
ncbi:MAG: hypothetical protein WD512_10490 [Candidatus Paceibacterota bacterium]